MAITSMGIGSGLDLENIIRGLMIVESQPLNIIKARQSTFNTQLSDYGKLKSAISSFQSAMAKLDSESDFKLFTATSSDEDVFTATASSTVSAGSYKITTNTLAVAQKMGSVTQADKDTTTFGTAGDTLQITIDSSSFTVDTGAKTLGEIRDAINGASDNTGVTATIIQESDSSFYLVLTSDNTGKDYDMTLVWSSGTDPLTMGETVGSLNALIDIDGYTITRQSNTITDAIEGVTLNLVKADATSQTLTIANDDEGVTTAVQDFVSAYNTLQTTLTSLRAGNLKGDSTLLSISSQLRNIFNTSPSGLTTDMISLSEVGIKTEKDGSLSLNTSDLTSKLASDFNGVAELFGDNDQGFAFRLEELADDLLDIEGVIKAREDGLNTRIDNAKDDITSMEYRLTLIEERYRKQFTALDSLLMGLQSTSRYLSQALSYMPATNAKK